MQNLSHDIENYILSLLDDEEENFISLRRKELAEMFECVPSQINYVLRSRFTPEHGYLIESRRGEHGYIKIFRITCDSSDEKVNHIEELVGDDITFRDASKLLSLLNERGFITARERLLMEVSLRHISSDPYHIAELLKKMLTAVVAD